MKDLGLNGHFSDKPLACCDVGVTWVLGGSETKMILDALLNVLSEMLLEQS